MNYSSSSVSPVDTFINAKEKAIPLFGSFELTPRCNMHCGMCYVHLGNDEIKNFGKELDAQQWTALGRQAAKAGTLFLCITGGEPTLHPQFCEIYSALSSMGFIITLQSNLYEFSDKCFEIIKKFPPREIKFTIYGASNNTYSKVCGVPDGFTKVMYNIQSLKSEGIMLSSVTTVTKDNYNELAEIAELMKGLGIPWTSSSSLKKSVRGADRSVEKFRLDDSMYTNLCDDVLRSVNDMKKKQTSHPCQICKQYKTGYWIKWDGKMTFCSFLSEPDIDASALGFDESWKRLIEFEEKLIWPEDCRECEISDSCPKCAASIATESGSVYKVSEDYCNNIKNLLKTINGGKDDG